MKYKEGLGGFGGDCFLEVAGCSLPGFLQHESIYFVFDHESENLIIFCRVLCPCTFHEAIMRRDLRVPIPTRQGIDLLNIFSGEGNLKWYQAALDNGKG